MPEITFKKETAPQRCEICHQSDLFDAEQNHCARCASIAIKQMAQASAATIIALAPPTPRLWRLNGAMPWMASLLALPFTGVYFSDSGTPELSLLLSIGPVVITFFSGIGLEALIKHVVRARTGHLPFNIERMIDDWFALSFFLTLVLGLIWFIGLVYLFSVFGIGPAFFEQSPLTLLLLLPAMFFSMWLSYKNELRKRRRFLNRTADQTRNTPQ